MLLNFRFVGLVFLVIIGPITSFAGPNIPVVTTKLVLLDFGTRGLQETEALLRARILVDCDELSDAIVHNSEALSGPHDVMAELFLSLQEGNSAHFDSLAFNHRVGGSAPFEYVSTALRQDKLLRLVRVYLVDDVYTYIWRREDKRDGESIFSFSLRADSAGEYRLDTALVGNDVRWIFAAIEMRMVRLGYGRKFTVVQEFSEEAWANGFVVNMDGKLGRSVGNSLSIRFDICRPADCEGMAREALELFDGVADTLQGVKIQEWEESEAVSKVLTRFDPVHLKSESIAVKNFRTILGARNLIGQDACLLLSADPYRIIIHQPVKLHPADRRYLDSTIVVKDGKCYFADLAGSGPLGFILKLPEVQESIQRALSEKVFD